VGRAAVPINVSDCDLVSLSSFAKPPKRFLTTRARGNYLDFDRSA
jgi:hypothetical protein